MKNIRIKHLISSIKRDLEKYINIRFSLDIKSKKHTILKIRFAQILSLFLYSSTMPDFKKYFIIPAAPEELYAALTFKPTIELWTGSPAVFTAEVGSEFSLWDDNISGNNRILELGKLIEQEWYFGERDQPSIVRMKLHDHPKGTSLEVNHTNIPEEDFDDIVAGWQEMYIGSLMDFYRD